LNERLHRLAFPMPSSNLVLDSLRDKKFYSVLDLANAYLSVPLNPETNHLTAFVTRRGMYKFLRLVGGLASAPAVFNQLVIQRLFSDLQWSQVLCFVDDLTLPSSTFDEGLHTLETVFERLQGAGLN
jgi:hypothetical protein